MSKNKERLLNKKPYMIVGNHETGLKIAINKSTGANPGDLYYGYVDKDGTIIFRPAGINMKEGPR